MSFEISAKRNAFFSYFTCVYLKLMLSLQVSVLNAQMYVYSEQL